MSYPSLIEINIICIAVLLITLLQFRDSILRHLEERILGFTIIDTIVYIVLSTVTKMLYAVHVQSDLYTSNQKICVIYAVLYALSLSSSLILAQLWFSFIFLRIRKAFTPTSTCSRCFRPRASSAFSSALASAFTDLQTTATQRRCNSGDFCHSLSG